MLILIEVNSVGGISAGGNIAAADSTFTHFPIQTQSYRMRVQVTKAFVGVEVLYFALSHIQVPEDVVTPFDSLHLDHCPHHCVLGCGDLIKAYGRAHHDFSCHAHYEPVLLLNARFLSVDF